MHSWTMINCTEINSQSTATERTLQSAPVQLLHCFKAPFINSFDTDNLIVRQDFVLVSLAALIWWHIIITHRRSLKIQNGIRSSHFFLYLPLWCTYIHTLDIVFQWPNALKNKLYNTINFQDFSHSSQIILVGQATLNWWGTQMRAAHGTHFWYTYRHTLWYTNIWQ